MTKLEQITMYRDSPSLSQSYLKSSVLSKRKHTDKKPTLKMTVGSYTDCLLTSPELIDELYTVMDIDVPDKIYEILVKTAELGEWNTLTIYNAMNQVGYYQNRINEDPEKDTRIKDVLPHKEIYEILRSGKTCISEKKKAESLYAANRLLTDSKTSQHFEQSITILYQCPLYWTIDGVPCKGLTDLLVLGSDTVQIKDIKITNLPLSQFRIAAKRFRYDFQLSFYYKGMIEVFPQYKPINPCLIVYSTADDKCEVFNLSDMDINIGAYGAIRMKENIQLLSNEIHEVNEHIFGWHDAIEIYKQAKLLDLPDFDIGYYRNEPQTLDLWL